MERTYLELISGERRGLLASTLRGMLSLLEVPYRFAVTRRNRAFDRGRGVAPPSPVPVISVGNLTVGGTGKTPMVEWLVERGLREGNPPGILLRGYRKAPGSELNDEGQWLASRFPQVPVVAAADRVVGADRLHVRGARWIVLDDGFQHRRLPRDLDLVLIDATRPDGFGHVLPRGLLREPLSGLARAQVVVLTRCDQVEVSVLDALEGTLRARFPHAFWTRATHAPIDWLTLEGTLALHALERGPLNLVSGLAHPRGFERTLSGLGFEIREHRTFQDHHAYTLADVERLEPGLPWVTTTKDWVKLEPLLRAAARTDVWALRIALSIADGDALWRRVVSACEARSRGLSASS